MQGSKGKKKEDPYLKDHFTGTRHRTAAADDNTKSLVAKDVLVSK